MSVLIAFVIGDLELLQVLGIAPNETNSFWTTLENVNLDDGARNSCSLRHYMARGVCRVEI